jgi:type III restriction enzyme
MKFHFKVQQYQTDAVEAVCRVFSGQGYSARASYIRDLGKVERDKVVQLTIDTDGQNERTYDPNDLPDWQAGDTGYKNSLLDLSETSF